MNESFYVANLKGKLRSEEKELVRQARRMPSFYLLDREWMQWAKWGLRLIFLGLLNLILFLVEEIERKKKKIFNFFVCFQGQSQEFILGWTGISSKSRQYEKISLNRKKKKNTPSQGVIMILTPQCIFYI